MKLHYRAIPGGNFGDDLNLLVWPEIFPDLNEHHPAATLYGIGTILGGEHDPRALKVVLGSGLGYRSTPKLDGTWDIRWVRGPYSAQLLGLSPDKALGDGALLWSGLATPGNRTADDVVGLIPHHATWESFDWPVGRSTIRHAGHRPETLARRTSPRKWVAARASSPNHCTAQSLRTQWASPGQPVCCPIASMNSSGTTGWPASSGHSRRACPIGPWSRRWNAARLCRTGWRAGLGLAAGPGAMNYAP